MSMTPQQLQTMMNQTARAYQQNGRVSTVQRDYFNSAPLHMRERAHREAASMVSNTHNAGKRGNPKY